MCGMMVERVKMEEREMIEVGGMRLFICLAWNDCLEEGASACRHDPIRSRCLRHPTKIPKVGACTLFFLVSSLQQAMIA